MVWMSFNIKYDKNMQKVHKWYIQPGDQELSKELNVLYRSMQKNFNRWFTNEVSETCALPHLAYDLQVLGQKKSSCLFTSARLAPCGFCAKSKRFCHHFRHNRAKKKSSRNALNHGINVEINASLAKKSTLFTMKLFTVYFDHTSHILKCPQNQSFPIPSVVRRIHFIVKYSHEEFYWWQIIGRKKT